MSAEIAARCIGLLGDATTFAGALILALKEAGEGARKEEALVTEETLDHHPEFRDLLIDLDGVILRKPGDVELASAHRASRRARLGAWILVVGFVFLLISRLIELFTKPTH